MMWSTGIVDKIAGQEEKMHYMDNMEMVLFENDR